MMTLAWKLGALSMLCLAVSCTEYESTFAVQYRFIQQITAYQDDGTVMYSDFVAKTGTAALVGGGVFNVNSSAEDSGVNIRVGTDSQRVVIAVDRVETQGDYNTWIRIKKPTSDYFGPDTELEIRVKSNSIPSQDN